MAPSRTERVLANARTLLEANPLYRQPEWVAAYQRVLALLPLAANSIAAPYDLVPDSILEVAKHSSASIEAVVLFNPWRSDPAGYGTTPFEDYKTLDLFDLVFAERPPSRGPLWFIPDDCFGRGTPHLIQGEDLRTFLQSHKVDLNSDALFIWNENPRITLIHHSGAYFHLVFPECQ